MNANKKSFIYYADWAEQTLALPNDLRLKVDDAVKRYVLYGEEPKDREVLYSMFGLMRMQIDRDQKKWNDIRQKRSLAGAKGASVTNRQKSAKVGKCQQNTANSPVNDNDNVNDNVKVNVNTNKIRNKVACSIPFDDFWNLYGKKVDRKKCEKKWMSLNDSQRKLAIQHVPKYTSSNIGRDIKFRKNPLTYLNGECWNDEIIEEHDMNTGRILLDNNNGKFDKENEW